LTSTSTVRAAAPFDLRRELVARAGVGEVGRDRLRAHAVLTLELGGETLQRLDPAGDQRQPVAAASEAARELLADTRGRAGDERCRLLGRLWKRHDPGRYALEAQAACSSPGFVARRLAVRAAGSQKDWRARAVAR